MNTNIRNVFSRAIFFEQKLPCNNCRHRFPMPQDPRSCGHGCVQLFFFTFLDERSDPWHLGDKTLGPSLQMQGSPISLEISIYRLWQNGLFKGLVAQGLSHHKRRCVTNHFNSIHRDAHKATSFMPNCGEAHSNCKPIAQNKHASEPCNEMYK